MSSRALQLFFGALCLLLALQQLVFGKLEVALERVEIAPGGKVGHAILFSALHHLFGALERVGEILLKLLLVITRRRRIFVAGQRRFQVIAQSIDHAVVQILDHLSYLPVLSLEIFEPEPKRLGASKLGPADGVVIERLQMKNRLFALAQRRACPGPI